MLENLLIKNLREVITTGFENVEGLENAKVLQAYQPIANGAEMVPTVYLSRIGDKRYGFNKRLSVDDSAGNQVTTNTQLIETTFQINAWIKRSLKDVDQFTANDLVQKVAAIFSTDETMTFLKSKNLSILRITEIRNPYFKDDNNQNEASPSFDVTVIHSEVHSNSVEKFEEIESNIKRV